MLDEATPQTPSLAPPSSPSRGIGKIERVPLRDVWRHEAHNLTTWLEENIDVLNDALDLNLTNVDREQSAGAVNVAPGGETHRGGGVAIGNQLGGGGHDPPGKLPPPT